MSHSLAQLLVNGLHKDERPEQEPGVDLPSLQIVPTSVCAI